MKPASKIPIIKKSFANFKTARCKACFNFGSFARGEAKAKSDVDLLIEYKTKDKSLFDLVDLKSELEETLGRKVDIVTYESIYWRLREQILAEQVVIL